MNLGENIYRLRTEKHMSQGDLADALEVSRQSVSKWENNSATPELDKLIKMSGLFDVSLDALVGNTAQERDAEVPGNIPAPPVQQVIVQTHFRPLAVRQILGIVLICVGFLFLPFALSATHYTPMLTCLILFGTLTLCGVVSLLFSYPFILWGWVLLGAFSLYFLLLHHWESDYYSLTLILVALAAMILWTIHADRRGTIHVPQWLWWTGGMTIAGLLILLCMNIIPPFWISEAEHAVAQG